MFFKRVLAVPFTRFALSVLKRPAGVWSATHGVPLPFTMKVDTPQFRALFTPELQRLVDVFQRHGHEIRIAGGAVRDLLMQLQPHDLDFATTATPEQMKLMMQEEDIRMINVGGEKHGTITPRINDTNFEVTTLRIDVVTDGRRAEVRFTMNWHEDAGRRDLTINAMFLGLDGTLYDYFHGRDDLEKRRVVFVGDASTRLQEDYLRILRYFRFFGKIAVQPNAHDAATLSAIQENIEGLARVSGERIWMEVKKILAGNYCMDLLEVMLNVGIAPFIGLPSSINLQEFRKVRDRVSSLKLQPITLLSTLLSNEEEVLQLNKRLKLSSYERDLAVFMVNHRDDTMDSKPLRPYKRMVIITKGKMKDVQEWACEVLAYKGETALADEMHAWKPPKFPVSGYTLAADCGLKPGPMIAKVILRLKELWVDSDFLLLPEELLKRVPSVVEALK